MVRATDSCVVLLLSRTKCSLNFEAKILWEKVKLFVLGVANLSSLKFSVVSYFMDQAVDRGGLWVPLLIWVSFGAGMTLVAAVLVSFLEPVAAGSGIPQIKCFLNGVKIPRVVRIQTLFCKAIGVMFSVAGGLAVGKEGPMIHSGAVVAAGLSQGASKSFNWDFGLFEYFRHDNEKRDFVSGGAAAGVAAAFGSPVGGVLFSLEEGASFWNQALTWRVLFSAMVSGFTLNFALSWYHGHFGELSYTGLVNFGVFSGQPYNWYELPIFCLMGAIGGLLGALFNAINYRITLFRFKFVRRPIIKVLEAMVVGAVSCALCFLLIYSSDLCSADDLILSAEDDSSVLQLFCNDGQFNVMSTLTFVTPETAVKCLFHAPLGSFNMPLLLLFSFVYYVLACWTYGLAVPSGLFIPSLLIGAAWGRCVGIFLGHAVGEAEVWVDCGKYALIGAAANLGGVVRMTISLTVILMEATGNVTFGLPLMLVLMTAKFVGDIFNEGIYDMHIHLMSVPILGWEAPSLSHQVKAVQVMNSPVKTLKTVEKVDSVFTLLSDPKSLHNGYPVVDEATGQLRGLILRDHLLILLQRNIFREFATDGTHSQLKLRHLRDAYPRFPTINDIPPSVLNQGFTIDLEPYMNTAPYIVSDKSTLSKIFTLFRALGLRHLCVINSCNQVIGMVTRKDLARFKSKTSNSVTKIYELSYVRN